jgi:hypothetical protein
MVTSLIRLAPVRSIAYRLIDLNVFRQSLEERLKRDYIARTQGDPAVAAPIELRPTITAEGPHGKSESRQHRAAGN